VATQALRVQSWKALVRSWLVAVTRGGCPGQGKPPFVALLVKCVFASLSPLSDLYHQSSTTGRTLGWGWDLSCDPLSQSAI